MRAPAIAFDPVRRTWTEGRQAGAVPVPRLQGSLDTDEASLDWAARDYGALVRHRPLAVLRPSCIEDIQAIMEFAEQTSLRVVPRGQGHSLAGQAQAPDGIVVDMRALNTIQSLTSDQIIVDAGTRWSEIVAATLPRGLTPPVLTDYIELTVGGTLSVGGLGGTSYRHGAQTDNVLSLDVLTPDGSLRACSPTVEPELFDAVRATNGRAGIIVRATLALLPAPESVAWHRLPYSSLTEFLHDQTRLVRQAEFDYVEGHIKLRNGKISYEIEAVAFTPQSPAVLDELGFDRTAAAYETMSYWDFANRLAEGELVVGEAGVDAATHPWCNVLLPATAAETFITEASEDLTRRLYGEMGLVLAYPLLRHAFSTPGLRLPDEDEVVYLVAALRYAAPMDSATITAMTTANSRWHQDAMAAGGTPYLAPFVTS